MIRSHIQISQIFQILKIDQPIIPNLIIGNRKLNQRLALSHPLQSLVSQLITPHIQTSQFLQPIKVHQSALSNQSIIQKQFSQMKTSLQNTNHALVRNLIVSQQ